MKIAQKFNFWAKKTSCRPTGMNEEQYRTKSKTPFSLKLMGCGRMSLYDKTPEITKACSFDWLIIWGLAYHNPR